MILCDKRNRSLTSSNWYHTDRYYLFGKRVVYRTCIHSAGTWIGPCGVSFRICLVKTQTGIKLGVRGHQMLPSKVSSCQTVSLELKQNTWTARDRIRKLKKNNRRKNETLTQVPGIWCQKTGTHRDSVFGVACAWSSPLFSEAMHWNKKWSRFLFQALPDARTPVTFRDANLKRLRNPPPCEIHGLPAQVRCWWRNTRWIGTQNETGERVGSERWTGFWRKCLLFGLVN